MADVNAMRRKVHELVEAGDILGAIETAGGHHGFRKFPVLGGKAAHSLTISWMIFDDFKARVMDDTLNIGIVELHELEEHARRDAKRAEKEIEQFASHEGGHIYKPKKTVKMEKGMTRGRVPYSLEEILNAQLKKMLPANGNGDIPREFFTDDADVPRESQANLYAAVKYHEGRDREGLKEGMALQVLSYADSMVKIGLMDEIDKPGMAYYYATRMGYPWLKPKVAEEIVENAMEIDRRYCQSNKLRGGRWNV